MVLRIGLRPTRPGRYRWAETRDGPRFTVEVYEGDDGRLWQRIVGSNAANPRPVEHEEGAWSEEPIEEKPRR
jgi:hypothetical protein